MRTEKALLDSVKFSLLGKRRLQTSTVVVVVVVDVAESQIERPQKISDAFTAARRSATR